MRANYANRGMHLEEIIRLSNSQYQRKGIAQIDKFPTPIAPERVVNGKVYGHYAKKSTVDYIGTVKSGKSICFDCKETATNRFPLLNIYQHQIDYMQSIHTLGGFAFIVICFTGLGRYFRLDYQDLYKYWQIYESSAGKGKRAPGTASIPLEAFTCEIKPEQGYYLHYLKGVVD